MRSRRCTLTWWVRSLLVPAVAVVALTACASEETMPAPLCANGGSSLIVAQSVPGAELVPCFEPLPEGWSVARVRVDQDGTLVALDSDRAGDDAAKLNFRSSCSIDGAVVVPGAHDGAERHDRVERLVPGFRADTHHVFPGGCVTLHYEFDDGSSATEAVAVEDALALIPRREIEDNVRETFIDEEL